MVTKRLIQCGMPLNFLRRQTKVIIFLATLKITAKEETEETTVKKQNRSSKGIFHEQIYLITFLMSYDINTEIFETRSNQMKMFQLCGITLRLNFLKIIISRIVNLNTLKFFITYLQISRRLISSYQHQLLQSPALPLIYKKYYCRFFVFIYFSLTKV